MVKTHSCRQCYSSMVLDECCSISAPLLPAHHQHGILHLLSPHRLKMRRQLILLRGLHSSTLLIAMAAVPRICPSCSPRSIWRQRWTGIAAPAHMLLTLSVLSCEGLLVSCR